MVIHHIQFCSLLSSLTCIREIIPVISTLLLILLKSTED